MNEQESFQYFLILVDQKRMWEKIYYKAKKDDNQRLLLLAAKNVKLLRTRIDSGLAYIKAKYPFEAPEETWRLHRCLEPMTKEQHDFVQDIIDKCNPIKLPPVQFTMNNTVPLPM